MLSGGSYEVNDCTSSGGSNGTGCAAKSDGNKVLPPVLSARLTTKVSSFRIEHVPAFLIFIYFNLQGKATIDGGRGGGKVTVRAKLPRG